MSTLPALAHNGNRSDPGNLLLPRSRAVKRAAKGAVKCVVASRRHTDLVGLGVWSLEPEVCEWEWEWAWAWEWEWDLT